MKSKGYPLKLPTQLIREAEQSAFENSLTLEKQLEKWIKLGKLADKEWTPAELAGLIQGSMKVSISKHESQAIDPMSVVKPQDDNEANEVVRQTALVAGYAYQASTSHPKMLEKVYKDGRVEVGVFKNGEFSITAKP